MDFSTLDQDSLKIDISSKLADGLGIDQSLIAVTGFREGSVIVDYTIESDATQTIEELKAL